MSYDLEPTHTLRHGVDYHAGLSASGTIYLYPQEDGRGPRLPPEMSVEQADVLVEKLNHLTGILRAKSE